MADVSLTITAKDAHVSRIIDAMNYGANKEINIGIANSDGESYTFSYEYDPKSGTNKQFAERFIKEFLRAFTRCYELGTDLDRYKTDVQAVTSPSQSVPDEIVE